MDITIHASFLPHDDPDASLAFSRRRRSREAVLEVEVLEGLTTAIIGTQERMGVNPRSQLLLGR
jgi:hypothetical protein